MAIGVTDGPGSIAYSVPLKTDDVEWTIEHLRELADCLERHKVNHIQKIGAEIIRGYDHIDLVVTCPREG